MFQASGATTKSTCATLSSATIPPTKAGKNSSRPATEATKKLWDEVLELSKKEREAGGVLNADTSIVSTLTSHGAGYIDKDLEKIVGLQTDEPFKRSLQPFGGIKMAEQALNMYGYEIDPEVKAIFTKYRQNAQRRRIRRIHPRNAPCPPRAYLDGPARYLRQGQNSGRLPPRGALRHRLSCKVQREGQAQFKRRYDARQGARQGRNFRADKGAQKSCQDGGAVRQRHHPPCGKRGRGGAVALLRLPRRGKGTERRGDVDRPQLYLPRYLYRARLEARHPNRRAGAGDNRPVHNEAAHSKVYAHKGI